MANKFVRIILIVVLFVIFFEVGLVSSYTIVTAEAPNIPGLIDMQIQKISSIFNPETVNEALIKDPTPINITNKKDVAIQMQNLSNVDGVNVDSMNITTRDDKSNDNITVIYTGAIDELFGCRYGKLPYRSLKFEWKYEDKDSFQSAPLVAYPQADGYTRIVEYKKLPLQDVCGTCRSD